MKTYKKYKNKKRKTQFQTINSKMRAITKQINLKLKEWSVAIWNYWKIKSWKATIFFTSMITTLRRKEDNSAHNYSPDWTCWNRNLSTIISMIFLRKRMRLTRNQEIILLGYLVTHLKKKTILVKGIIWMIIIKEERTFNSKIFWNKKINFQTC